MNDKTPETNELPDPIVIHLPSLVKGNSGTPGIHQPSNFAIKRVFSAYQASDRQDLTSIFHKNHQRSPIYKAPILPDEEVHDVHVDENVNKSSFTATQEITGLQDKRTEKKPNSELPEPQKYKIEKIWTTINCICLGFYIINLFFALIGIIGLHFTNRIDQSDQTLNAQSIIRYKFDSSPLLDIQIRNIDQSCTAEYSELEIWTWPGVNAGCYCPNLSPQFYSSSECHYNCEDEVSIPEIGPLNVSYFQNIGFCGKQSVSNMTYPQQECKQNQTQCYPGGCFDNSEGCPITRITVDNPNNITKITVSTQLNSAPIIGLRLALSNQAPCLDPELIEIPSQIIYPLTSNSTMISQPSCGDFGEDNSAIELGDESELEVFQSQDWWSQVSSLQSYTNYIQGQSLTLYAIRQSIFSDKQICFSSNTSQYQNAQNLLNQIDWNLTGYPIIAISCLILLMVIVMCSGINFTIRETHSSNPSSEHHEVKDLKIMIRNKQTRPRLIGSRLLTY